MTEVDSWLANMEARIDAQKQQAVGDAVEIVDKQIQQHLVRTCPPRQLFMLSTKFSLYFYPEH